MPSTISFCFDDACRSAFVNALPVFKRFGVCGTIAPCADWLTDSKDGKRLSRHELRSLQASGWEIAAHSISHVALGHLPLRYEDELVPQSSIIAQSGLYYVPFGTDATRRPPMVFEDGVRMAEARNPRNLDERAGYFYDISTNSVVIRSNHGDIGELRLGSAERELEGARLALEEDGFEVSTFIPPNNSWSQELKTLSKEYYKFVAAAQGGGESAGINFHRNCQPHRLRRIPVRWEKSAETYIETIEKAFRKGQATVIFCLHDIFPPDHDNPNYMAFTPDKLEKILAWTQSNGVRVSPINSAVPEQQGKKDGS